MGKNQPQYQPLPIVRLVKDEQGRCYSVWEFTEEERARVAAGEPLVLEQLTFGRGFSPILPTVGLRERCPMDG